MKIALQLILLTVLVNLFSCKKAIQKVETSEIQTKKKKQDSVLKTPQTKTQKKALVKHYEYLFVSARSGLNYRTLPKGNVLGKFPLNTQLKVIEYTKITDQVKDNGKIIKGEWLGVEKDKDTVYVFNGFLSSNYTSSNIKLYYVSPYYKEENGETRTAFLNVSETYFENGERNENLILTEQNVSKDTIKLNLRQRKTFLKKSKISELDNIYIYQIGNNKIKTLTVKNSPVIACVNIYDSGSGYKKEELDYEFGFDLGESSYSYEDFVYIGQKNPFITGELKPIIWKKIDNKDFPKKFNTDLILDQRKKWIIEYKVRESYTFSNNDLNYYIQNLYRDSRVFRYILVINGLTKKILYKDVQISSEGTDLVPLTIEGQEYNYEKQWTGKLFKDKATVMFGFLSHSFGCPSITVLDETEPSIPILCDNRH